MRMNKRIRLILVSVLFGIGIIFAGNTVAMNSLADAAGVTFKNFYVIDGVYLNPFAFIKMYITYRNLFPALFDTPLNLYMACVVLGILASLLLPRLFTKKKRTSEGSAEWASFDDLKESNLLVSPNKTDKKTGIVLGTWYSGLVNYEKLHNFVSSLRKMAKKCKWKWSDDFFYTVLNVFCALLFVSRKYIVDNFDTHTFLCAPSRSGKGIGPITQTLLFWKDSMIVSDLKRENIRETGPYRKYELGHNVLEFAPTDTRPTARFNPINEIRWGTPNEGQDVSNIVTLLVGKPEGKDAHWKSNAISLIIGVLTHLKYKHAHINAEKDLKPGDKGYIETNFYHVYEWLTTTDKNEVDEYMTLQEKIQLELDYEHFPVVLMVHNESIEKPMIRREITLERAQEITTFSFEALKTPKKHPVIISCFNNFLSKPESEGGSVLSTAVTALSMFSEKIIVDNTCTSDFLTGDIKGGSKPTDLFLVVPPSDLARVEKLFSLIFEFIIMRTTENEAKAKSQRRCLLLIDEWPAFGKMSTLVTELGFIASYGLKTFLIVQGLDQVKRVYDNKIDFLGNCQIQVFFEGRDESTPKYVSEKLGNETILLDQVSSSGFFSKKNVTKIEKKRALLDPAEVAALSNTSVIIMGTKTLTLKIKSPKNKFFLNQDMMEKLNLGKKLDTFNQIGLRPDPVQEKTNTFKFYESVRWYTPEETEDIKALIPHLFDMESIDAITDTIDFTTLITALIRFDHASVDVDNWKNRISPSMEGYKTCSLSSLRSTIMVAKNAAEIHEKNILAMLQDTLVISEYEDCLNYLKNLPDNYLAISEDLKCFMNESR